MYNQLAIKVIEEKQQEILSILQDKNLLNNDNLIAKLMIYAIEHFDDEEKFARGVKYPKLDILIREHIFFIKQLNKIIESKDSENFIKLLNIWIATQINTSDKSLIDFLK
jgi:hemerythrin